ncbi:MAG: hypothetical protein WCL02_05860 [bacterium]
MKTEKEEIEKNKQKEKQKNQMKSNIDALEDLSVKQLQKLNEEGPITGIINSIQNKNIHINLTPTITGMIKSETKENTLMVGEKIKVNITNITTGTDKITGKHKRLISLEKSL